MVVSLIFHFICTIVTFKLLKKTQNIGIITQPVSKNIETKKRKIMK